MTKRQWFHTPARRKRWGRGLSLWTRWVAAVGLALGMSGLLASVTSSQEEQEFDSFVWPDGTSEQEKTAALEELLANREDDLARIRGDLQRFEVGSPEHAYLLEKEQGLEDYVAALRAHISGGDGIAKRAPSGSAGGRIIQAGSVIPHEDDL